MSLGSMRRRSSKSALNDVAVAYVSQRLWEWAAIVGAVAEAFAG